MFDEDEFLKVTVIIESKDEIKTVSIPNAKYLDLDEHFLPSSIVNGDGKPRRLVNRNEGSRAKLILDLMAFEVDGADAYSVITTPKTDEPETSNIGQVTVLNITNPRDDGKQLSLRERVELGQERIRRSNG